MLYTERWADRPFADVRAHLMSHSALWCTEDTLFRCCWQYRPRINGTQETFGTLELTPAGLTLAALSKPRCTALRSLLEEALGSLPIGERHVSALVTDSANWAPPDAAEVPILEEYAATRVRLRALHTLATQELTSLVDIGLIHSARPGMALVGRLLPAPRFAMLSGWGFAVQPEQVDQVLREVRRIAQTESRRARVSTLIRYCRNELPPLVMGEKTL
ncbi:MAG TPA: hypothetical protein VK464_21340 [Symbiobacteriaceae bacterium]|jgi:hypothetical protein|nr:hypothetical protein [Symbiobacteriaceae bacterium]